MGIAEPIATEDEFRTAMPRHAKVVFDYMAREPALKLQRWAFARAIGAPP
jgi:hypothetical protein